jgi:alanine racemase
MAKGISEKAVEMKKRAKIHIKVDTGMGRIGFALTEDSIKEVLAISQLPNIEVEGIFTHFSKADEVDKTYTYEQISKFDEFVKKLELKGLHIKYKHAANSAGIIEYSEAHYNIVRAGIALYGLYPSQEVSTNKIKLKPALSLISQVIFTKTVEKGTKISYGGIYTTKERSVIATVPVGYGDGFPRALSSKGRVLIRGQYAKIVGRVCMDQFMVDVTHIEGVCEGDEAVLIGKQGDNQITVEEIADIAGTINYEIVCQLGKRIPRVYYKDDEYMYATDYY